MSQLAAASRRRQKEHGSLIFDAWEQFAPSPQVQLPGSWLAKLSVEHATMGAGTARP